LLNDKDESVRFDAAKALLKIGDKSAISEVEKVLPTLEVYQRNMLSDSLRKIKEREK
jgi:HEAT repeat protein